MNSTADTRASVQVPKDAGGHAEGLRRVLLRIPVEWGRWISCGRGWYPILVELDEQLAAIFPHYELHQVKEKFGGLRFYWEAGVHGAGQDETVAGQAAFDRLRERAEQLVAEAERRASATCEHCGQPGQLCRTSGPAPWYRTLCPDCMHQDGYLRP